LVNRTGRGEIAALEPGGDLQQRLGHSRTLVSLD
jgi:hypothetical protein